MKKKKKILKRKEKRNKKVSRDKNHYPEMTSNDSVYSA